MRSKKTIRKLHPLTRALAKLQREVHSLERRMDKVIQLADEIEQEGRTNLRENANLRGRLAVHEMPAAKALWPDLPNGEGVAGEISSGIRVDPLDGYHG
jgi:hypothetical protein